MVGYDAMDTHETFLKLAIEEANKSVRDGQAPFGAVVTKNNKIVAATHNSVVRTCDPTAHAEINVLRKAGKVLNTHNFSGCILYSSCEPCPMCFSAIHWAQMDAIYYAASIEDAKLAGFRELEISNLTMKELGGATLEIYGPMLQEFGRVPFELFVANPDKCLY